MNEMINDDESLDFLAFQYISDDLSEDACAAFEARLLDDQAAREAVASAVELTLATRAVFADDAELVATREALQRPRGYRPWWSVALACSALVGLILVSRAIDNVKRQHAARPSADLAIAWNETRSEWPSTLLTDEQLRESTESLSDEELALPTWMVAAVSASTMETMPEETDGDTIPE